MELHYFPPHDCTTVHLKTTCVEGRMREQLSELMEHSRDLSNILVKSNLLKSLFSHPCSSDSLPSVNTVMFLPRLSSFSFWNKLGPSAPLDLLVFCPFNLEHFRRLISHFQVIVEISPHRNCLSFDLIYFVLKDIYL